jgi:hypothetical protein
LGRKSPPPARDERDGKRSKRQTGERTLARLFLEHDPEKWEPVFGKDHALVKSMIPKKPAPDLIRGGNRFSEKIMLKQKL